MTSPRNMTMTEFVTAFQPYYDDDVEWAQDHCISMHDVWNSAKPTLLIWIATRPGVLDDMTLRLFACWSVRQVWHLLTDARSRNAIEVAERFAVGDASREEMAAAQMAAQVVGWSAARDPAEAASRAAARGAAQAAGEHAARVAAWAAAQAAAQAVGWAAVKPAEWSAVGDAAWDAAEAAQAAWLRSQGNPFSREPAARLVAAPQINETGPRFAGPVCGSRRILFGDDDAKTEDNPTDYR